MEWSTESKANGLELWTNLERGQFIAQFDETQVQFTAKVVRQTPVIVVDAKVGAANLADAQFLLLIRGRGHWISIIRLWKRRERSKLF